MQGVGPLAGVAITCWRTWPIPRTAAPGWQSQYGVIFLQCEWALTIHMSYG